ncbi:uncharacterized protein [Lepidochelys kempii]|uniref:uncharacterized protein n=1 Tax=Lepidochelys kempii TaxID=8472 RepID=UPI003C702033
MQSSSAQVTMMESQNRKRAPAWTEREVRDLIAVWGEESVLSELRSSFRNAKTFVKISQGMKDRGHNRDPKQCRVKLKELRQAYQKTREANSRSGSEPQTCRFYDELHAILGGSATTTPAVLFDSFNGDGGNTEAGFGDEEDEEEEEVVDSSQQASGETGFPDSQELFLTLDLEPVPPEPTQGCLLDPAGGEGTSAGCVSMITGSSPSQRLVKLRKKKKRTRDEIFSELMLSSHTDRAQTNAWSKGKISGLYKHLRALPDEWCMSSPGTLAPIELSMSAIAAKASNSQGMRYIDTHSTTTFITWLFEEWHNKHGSIPLLLIVVRRIPQHKHAELEEKYAKHINLLTEEFDRRLTLSKEDGVQLKLIEDPFSVDPKEVPLDLQLEVIELQCSTVYRNKHRESSP